MVEDIKSVNHYLIDKDGQDATMRSVFDHYVALQLVDNDLKQINQLANFALLEWPDNIDISDSSPSEYVPALRNRF